MPSLQLTFQTGIAVMIIIGSLLFESAVAWIQTTTLGRAAAGSIPVPWLIASVIRGLAVMAGSVVVAFLVPWLALLVATVVFPVGLASWPVAWWIEDARRMANTPPVNMALPRVTTVATDCDAATTRLLAVANRRQARIVSSREPANA